LLPELAAEGLVGKAHSPEEHPAHLSVVVVDAADDAKTVHNPAVHS
jgi:hypothetical protein